MEKINILMATYNGRRYVAKQVESILNQTYKDFRLIISDDCSTDSTLKILQEYEKDSRVEIYCHQENQGVVSNFEFLIGKVRSELFMFADQDDIWESDKIEKTLEVMENNNLDLVYTDLEVVDSKLNQIAPSYWNLKGLDYKIKKYNNFESLYLNNFVTGCTMLVKSKWINNFLPLPKNSKYVLHDYWISLIVSQNGKIGYLDKTTVKYRQHNNNKIGSRTKSEELNSLDEIRNLFIDVKIEHFEIFIQNENRFKLEYYKSLNKDALKYYEYLKTVNKFTLKYIFLFMKLYKYESLNYKLKNFVILHMPIFARIYFKKLKQKRELEECLKKKEELKIVKNKKSKENKDAELKKEEKELKGKLNNGTNRKRKTKNKSLKEYE